MQFFFFFLHPSLTIRGSTVTPTTFLIKLFFGRLERWLSTCCPPGGSWFDSQYSCVGSQLSISPVPQVRWCLLAFPSTRQGLGAQTDIQARTHKVLKRYYLSLSSTSNDRLYPLEIHSMQNVFIIRESSLWNLLPECKLGSVARQKELLCGLSAPSEVASIFLVLSFSVCLMLYQWFSTCGSHPLGISLFTALNWRLLENTFIW